ncbi:hypothetical protein Mapa_005228 [Marchantia paleacea]|nr:hypothetical protein Mapa_005228 [Marchantia paleacea]
MARIVSSNLLKMITILLLVLSAIHLAAAECSDEDWHFMYSDDGNGPDAGRACNESGPTVSSACCSALQAVLEDSTQCFCNAATPASFYYDMAQSSNMDFYDDCGVPEA